MRTIASLERSRSVLTNLFWPEQLRRLAEMPGKVSDAVDVDPDGVRRSVAYPQGRRSCVAIPATVFVEWLFTVGEK